MKLCGIYQGSLKACLDGELKGVRLAVLRSHLAGCPACRKELSEMEETAKRLRASETGSLGAALRARILSTAASQTDAGRTAGAVGGEAASRAAGVRAKLRNPRAVWAAGAIAVLAWFALYPAASNWIGTSNNPGEATSQARNQAPAVPPAEASPETKAPVDLATRFPAHIPAEIPLGDRTLRSASGLAGSDGGLMSSAGKGAVEAFGGKRSMSGFSDGMKRARTLDKLGIGVLRTPGAAGAGQPAAAGMDAAIPETRLVHREAQVTLQVGQVEQKGDEVEQLATSVGGYVADNELTTGDDNLKSATITLKIPVQEFTSILGRLTRLGDVTAKSVTGEDLTERVSDSQQANSVLTQDLSVSQERLHEARNHAEREVTAENVRDLRIRVAQERARIQLYRKLYTLATIGVELHEKPAPQKVSGTGFVGEMQSTATDALHSFSSAARIPVLLMIWMLAYSPVWILLVVTYRYLFRH